MQSLLNAAYGEFFRYCATFYSKDEVLNIFSGLGKKCGYSLITRLVEEASFSYTKTLKVDMITCNPNINSSTLSDTLPKDILKYTSTRDVEKLIAERIFPMIFKKDTIKYKSYVAPAPNEVIFKGISISTYFTGEQASSQNDSVISNVNKQHSNISSALAYQPPQLEKLYQASRHSSNNSSSSSSALSTITGLQASSSVSCSTASSTIGLESGKQLKKSDMCRELLDEIKSDPSCKLLGIERFSLITLIYNPSNTKLFLIPYQIKLSKDATVNRKNLKIQQKETEALSLYLAMIEAANTFIEMMIREVIVLLGFNADVKYEKQADRTYIMSIAITDKNCYQ